VSHLDAPPQLHGRINQDTMKPKALIATLAALCLSACGIENVPTDPNPSPAPGDELTSEAKALWVFQDRIWTNPNIPVCWENPAVTNATQRGWVQNAVAVTWSQVSNVNFTGWGTCTASSKGLRVRIIDAQPKVASDSAGNTLFGRQLDGIKNGVNLNFTYLNWGTACAPTTGTIATANCIRDEAIHEFGHALGFAHEQDRSDTPGWCLLANPATGTTGNLKPFDPMDTTSVMSGCNAQYNNRVWPYILSASDVRGVQAIYGGRPGMIVGGLGRCLDVRAFGKADDTVVQTWDCLYGTNQVWNHIFDGPIDVKPLAFVSEDSGKYMDAPFVGNGAPIGIRTMAGASRQNFHMDNAALRGFDGNCVDVIGNNNTNGVRVQMWSCNGTTAQQWTFRADGTIQNQGGRCLELAFGQNGNAGRVQIWDCNGAANQRWNMLGGGLLQSQASNRCLDVTSWGLDGALLQTFDCLGGTNQSFRLRSPIQLGNKCLDIPAGVNANGVALQLWDCNGGQNQSFDYYW
jgi:hypothetical protein